ncbi:hypothetical protein [Capnocytophaga sp.]|uniref:hypothetical protein n=1 Tax=Capnocytophaga sp. TaxID=44737 RepID=UPI0026DC9366|nr:hypothetical protein [Capnocytophaga sp.]MDO5105954.1 hypothetical protein [Capnocytophaga sp.]
MRVFFLYAVLFFMTLTSCYNEKEDAELRATKEEREALLKEIRSIFIAHGADPSKVSISDTITKAEIKVMYSRMAEIEEFAKAVKEPVVIDPDDGETRSIDLTEEEFEIVKEMLNKNSPKDPIDFIHKRRDSITAKRTKDSLDAISAKGAFGYWPWPTRVYIPNRHAFYISRRYKRLYGMIDASLNVIGSYFYEQGSSRIDGTSLTSNMTGIMLGKSYKHLWGNMSFHQQPTLLNSSSGKMYIPGAAFQGYGEFTFGLLPDYIGSVYSENIRFHGYYVPGGYDSMTLE